MKNIIGYYYGIYPLDIYESNKNYFFEYDNATYVLVLLLRPSSDIDSLYDLNIKMIEDNVPMHRMLKNNNDSLITTINNNSYALLKIGVNSKYINDDDIFKINFMTTGINVNNVLDRSAWVNLWEIKNDFFEEQLSELGNKYLIMSEYLNYYIGLAENAILYVKEALSIDQDARKCVCHKRIRYNENAYSLYNPLNLIYDYNVRDICEYAKSTFFVDKKKAFDIVVHYINSANLNYKEMLLFYGRLIYPSYFFDLYDDIVNGIKKEKDALSIITKASSYEQFLRNVHQYISKTYYEIPYIDWLIS